MGRMYICRVVAGLALVLAVAGLVHVQVGAQGGKLEPVKVQFKADKKGDKEVINVTVEVEKNWHIYANPVGDDTLTGAETVVKVEPKGKVNAEVKYPRGTDHKDKILNIAYKVYVGKVTIPIHVQRNAGDKTPVEISITYQACDDNKCLPPVTVKQTVP